MTAGVFGRWLRWSGLTLLAMVLLYGLGLYIPRRFITNGLEQTFSMPFVAREGYETATLLVFGNPLANLLVTALRVKTVEYAPGHCPNGPGRGDYRALIRIYGPFGIPLKDAYATCNGTRFSIVADPPKISN